ncbi:MAG TPA: helix-turn-helix domain-containing protein [Thermodesulfovibrionales bacterium]|nr:helix-turn-helix domain-containing protein [Thermodesulfovibrionales bacterium]
MAGKDIIQMRLKEVKRLKVIQEAIDRRITQKVAASMVGISERQVRRLVRVVREEGETGIIHKARGKPSKRKLSEKVREKVLGLYRGRYGEFGPTLASEKFSESEGIVISKETLRKWLVEAGLWKRRRRRSGHRQWRPRKECFGEMVQMDGSHHDWLEGRGSELVLMGYIDDATNEVFGRFYDHEGTKPAMDSFKRYIRKYGLPVSEYLDRHTTYKSTKKLAESGLIRDTSPILLPSSSVVRREQRGQACDCVFTLSRTLLDGVESKSVMLPQKYPYFNLLIERRMDIDPAIA